jgi:hypothetical protein
LIWLHWDSVELASVAVPLVVVVAAMRLAGVSWVWAAVAGAATAGVTYLAANELFDVWVRECLAENRTPPPPPSWPWSPRREFCDPSSGPALGGFAMLAAPTLVALFAAVLARTQLRPLGFAVLAMLIPTPLLPEIYVTSLPYYKLDEYPILHRPRLLPASSLRPATACYEYGIASGPRQSNVIRPEDRLTCVEFERTAAARSLAPPTDAGPTQLELEQVGKNLTAKGLPPEPGDTGVHGLVVTRAFELSVAKLDERQEAAYEGAVDASYVKPGAPASCAGGVSLRDPADDVADSTRVLVPTGLPSPDPRADLRALRLRVADGRVCVAYETAGELAGPMTFTFELRDSAAAERFRQLFTATLRKDGRVRVTGGGGALSIPAEVGLAGGVFTLVLDGQSFDEGRAMSDVGTVEPPLDRFGFVAAVRASLGGQRRVRDWLGRLVIAQAYRYPDGRRCLSDTVCERPPAVPLSAHARRIKPTVTQTCARLGGRVTRSPGSPDLACIVRYAGVPYHVLLNPKTGRVARREARFQRRDCRLQQRLSRQIPQQIANARHSPLRTDLFIWHPSTGVCEMRIKGQLVRPR